MKKTIYIAGALTPRGNRDDCENPAIEYLLNVRDMIRAAIACVKKGWAPFCPALDFQYFLCNEGEVFTEEEVKGVGLTWIPRCDAILMTPGWLKSAGSIAELDVAVMHDLQVYKSIEEVPDETD